ncbi:DUF362 domain-containing protein [bacterium]|nr:DUF362 domain-containing protein [bacterium]
MASENRHDVNRRCFLATSAVAAAVAAGGPLAEAADGPIVAVVRDKSKQVAKGRTIDAALTQKLVDKAVMTATGCDDIATAWGKLVGKTDKVAIKFNGLFRSATTHPEVIAAITKGLVDAGVNPDHIVVYDRASKDFQNTGLTIKKDRPGPLYYATDKNYGPEMKAGPVTTRLSKILLDADVLINVPLMKTHQLAGVTGAMKNHMGTVNNAGAFHKDENKQNTCRYVADISALEPVKAKTRICIADGLNAQYDRGPQFSPRHCWDYGGIIASTDFVALDTVLADIIRAKRVAEGLEPDFKPLRHLERAVELALGCGDLKKIQRMEMDI